MVCGCAKAPSADAFAFSLSSPGRRAAFAATQPAATTLLRKHEQTDSAARSRSEEHTSELQSPCNLVCRLLLEKKKNLRVMLRILLDARLHVCDAPVGP